MSLYKNQLKDWLSKQKISGESCLSIGGQNDDRKYFAEAEFEKWFTLDISDEFEPNILHDMNRPIITDDGDNTLDYEHIGSYDFVLAFELWDYIYDPVTAHENIFELLKPGGTYMGSYPFVYPHHEPIEMDYLRYTENAIRKLLQVSGFHAIDITERVATAGQGNLSAFVGAEGMRLTKRLNPYTWPIGYMVKAKK